MIFPSEIPTYSILLHPQQEIVERGLRRAEAKGFVHRYNRLMSEDASYAEMIEESSETKEVSIRDTPR